MTEPTTYFWSHFDTWVECPERYRLKYIVKEPSEFETTYAIKEGQDIHNALARRLGRLENFKAGNSLLMKRYHEMYAKEDLALGSWQTEIKLEPVMVASGILIAGKLDAWAPEAKLVRETKRKGRRYGLAKDMLQLMWYCLVAGTDRGQLDLVYPPAWERTEWGMERLDYTFSEEDFGKLREDIMKFHHSMSDYVLPPTLRRNHNSCHYCQFTKNCWGKLIVK